jgi:hypothetical protein
VSLSALGPLTTKSSADSISILPALSGRDAVAIRPSGLPVLKKNGTAMAGPLQVRMIATTRGNNARRLMAHTSGTCQSGAKMDGKIGADLETSRKPAFQDVPLHVLCQIGKRLQN